MGDIITALRSAQSGLIANQQLLNTASNNIANANTEGYSRKITNLKSIVVAGVGGGVSVSKVTRRIDEGLMRNLRTENGELNTYLSQEYSFERLQEFFGKPGDNDSISHLLESFRESIELLAVSPEKSLEASDVIQRVQEVLSKLESMSITIQELRRQADDSITDEVAEINLITAKIDEINDDIIANDTIGRDITDLEDQRDLEVDKLSKIVDIRYFSREDGDVVVYTKNGRTLVDTETPTITHTAASSLSATSTHSRGNISGIYVGAELAANDLTNEFVEGKLKGLITLRDTTLPNLQAQLDELASDLQQTVNQVHNRGTSFPGAQSMSGTRIFIRPTEQRITLDSGGDDVKLILFDSSGDQSAATTLDTIMQSASFGSGAQAANGPWTISEVAATIEDWLQGNGASGATASIGTDGRFSIALNTTTLNLGFRDESATADGSTNEDVVITYDSTGSGVSDDTETVNGFSYFFGLNDLIVHSRSDYMWDSNLVSSTLTTPASSQTLNFRDSTGTLTGSPLTVPAATSLTDLATLITDSVTNITAIVVPEGSGSRLRITHDTGNTITVTQGSGNTIIDELGLHVSATDISSALSVRADIASDPSRITTGRPQWNSELGSAGQYFMSVGDGTNVKALAELFTSVNSFEGAGGIPAISRTFTGYAAEIISFTSTLAASNSRDLESQRSLVEALQLKSDAVRGVNLDQEMSDLLIFEQAYAAAARVLSVIQNMIEDLERAVE